MNVPIVRFRILRGSPEYRQLDETRRLGFGDLPMTAHAAAALQNWRLPHAGGMAAVLTEAKQLGLKKLTHDDLTTIINRRFAYFSQIGHT
jgi:hypothetical protein